MAKRSVTEDVRLTLGVLTAAELGEGVSQRGLAADLGVALGLVNAYVKRCVRKGLLKVSQAPARRYRYYLTPAGFTEKARLTAEYLTISLSFFRRAKIAYSDVFDEVVRRRWTHVGLLGSGDLADIAMICAMERGIRIVAIVEMSASAPAPRGTTLVGDTKRIAAKIDGLILTSLSHPSDLLADARRAVRADRILIPNADGLGLPRLVSLSDAG